MARSWFVLRALRTPTQPSKEEEGGCDKNTSKWLTDDGSQANKDIASATVADPLVERELLKRGKEQDCDAGEGAKSANCLKEDSDNAFDHGS
jgi:hypothetical protein